MTKKADTGSSEPHKYDQRTVEAAMKAVEDAQFPDDVSHNLLVRAFKDRFKEAIRAALGHSDKEQD
jgi:hypothetical protein